LWGLQARVLRYVTLLSAYGKNVTEPTEKGLLTGIRSERRRSMAGAEYIRVIYGKKAQEFIVQNLEQILNGEAVE
ncbi:MAG: hypothetical protein LUE16_12365, partial [Lachnospiraceae bacterium]|nr:hypothetical protein [Lachnospiraceae bacterium]